MTSLGNSVFLPHSRIVSNITNSFPAVVTTTEDHGFHAGSFITIVIPYPNMMQELNNKTFLVEILSPTTFSIPYNTIPLTAFAAAPSILVTPQGPPFPAPPPFYTPSQVVQAIPAGEFNTLDNAVNNVGPRNP
jgi:hypothetical protein